MTHVTIHIVTNGSCVGSKAPAVGTPITKQASKLRSDPSIWRIRTECTRTETRSLILAGALTGKTWPCLLSKAKSGIAPWRHLFAKTADEIANEALLKKRGDVVPRCMHSLCISNSYLPKIRLEVILLMLYSDTWSYTPVLNMARRGAAIGV